jgi:hypothetical protein
MTTCHACPLFSWHCQLLQMCVLVLLPNISARYILLQTGYGQLHKSGGDMAFFDPRQINEDRYLPDTKTATATQA